MKNIKFGEDQWLLQNAAQKFDFVMESESKSSDEVYQTLNQVYLSLVVYKEPKKQKETLPRSARTIPSER